MSLWRESRTVAIAGLCATLTAAIVLLSHVLTISDGAVSSGVTALGAIVGLVAGKAGWQKHSEAKAVTLRETTDPGLRG